MTKAMRLGLIMTVWVASLLAQSAPEVALDTSSLSRQERVVLEYLRRDWAKDYRTTSIGLAAEVTKSELSHDSRLHLARFLEANQPSFSKLARHKTATVSLTPLEKRVARALLLRETEGKAGARLEEIAGDLKISSQSLREPLAFLQDLGVISSRGEGYDRHLRVAERFPRQPSRRIDFFSHLVEVNGREKFEVA